MLLFGVAVWFSLGFGMVRGFGFSLGALGFSPFARLLWQRFVLVCSRRLSLLSELKLKGSMLSGVYGRDTNKNIVL